MGFGNNDDEGVGSNGAGQGLLNENKVSEF